MKLEVTPDRKLVRRDGGSVRYALVSFTAPDAPRTGRLPVNVSLVLDRSGSMAGGKLDLARQAALHAVAALKPQDRFSVVFYDDVIDVVVPSTPATDAARSQAESALNRVGAGKTTALCDGWLRGCEQVALHPSTESVGRTLLLTDGLANVGETDPGTLIRHAGELRRRGVTTSTFGIGDDFDDVLLRGMADAGGGRFYYIERPEQIADFVAGEVGEALEVVAREVALQVATPDGVAVESLNDFTCRVQGTSWRVELGDLVARQQVEAILKLTFPAGQEGHVADLAFEVVDRDGVLHTLRATARWTWAGAAANDRQDRERGLDRRVAALYAAVAEQHAVAYNRAGDYQGASRMLLGCARRIRGYAGDDAELTALAERLERKAKALGRPQTEQFRKGSGYRAYTSLKGRTFTGRSSKMPVGIGVFPEVSQLRFMADGAIRLLMKADPDLFNGAEIFRDLEDGGFDALGSTPVLAVESEQRLTDWLQRQAPSLTLRIAFLDRALADNWFSHTHDQGSPRTVIASAFRVRDLADVYPGAFLAYELVLHGLVLLNRSYDPRLLLHPDTRGCLFDLCSEKQDLEIKLQTADLCSACRDALAGLGIPSDRVLRLGEVIRTLAALGRPAPSLSGTGKGGRRS